MGLSVSITKKDGNLDEYVEGQDGVKDLAIELRSDPQFVILGIKFEDGSMSNLFIDRMDVASIELFSDEAPDEDPGDEAEPAEEDKPSHLKLVH